MKLAMPPKTPPKMATKASPKEQKQQSNQAATVFRGGFFIEITRKIFILKKSIDLHRVFSYTRQQLVVCFINKERFGYEKVDFSNVGGNVGQLLRHGTAS